MRRRNFLRLGSGAAIGGALAACDAPDGFREAAATRPYTVLDWNEAALQAIHALACGPLAAARALAILHTCMYNAWAAYDDDARQTAHGVAVRLPRAERGAASKASAMSHAAHLVLADQFPARRAVFDARLRRLGLDPAAAALAAPLTPAGIGRSQAAAMLELCRRDEARTQDGGAAAPDGWCLQARAVAALDGHGDERDVKLFFVLSQAMAGIALATGRTAGAPLAARHLLRHPDAPRQAWRPGAADAALAPSMAATMGVIADASAAATMEATAEATADATADASAAANAAANAAASEVIRRMTGSGALAPSAPPGPSAPAEHAPAAAFGRAAGARAFDHAHGYWLGRLSLRPA